MELALLAGDSRLLQDERLSSGKRAWIEGRVTGELNLLSLLVRYAAREQGESLAELSREIGRLPRLRQQPAELQRAAEAMSERYPVPFRVDLQQPLTSDQLARSESLYNRLCLGCHATPAGEHSVIVGTLGSFSRSMSDDEWLARMLGGLRGDAYTGLENPFSDSDIARLFRYTRDSLR